MTTIPRLLVAFVGLVFIASCRLFEDPDDDREPFVGNVTGPFIPVGSRPFGLAISSSGTVLVTRQDADSIALFGIGASSVTTHAATGANPGDVVFTASGTQAIVSAFNAGTLHRVNATTGAQTASVTIGTNAYRLAMSSNGARVFVTTTDSKVFAVDLATFQKVDSVTLTGSLQGISRHPTTGQLAVSSTDGGVWLLNPSTLDVVNNVDVDGKPQEILFAPGGDEIYVALETGMKVLVLHATTLVRTDSILHTGAFTPFGMAISPDGKTLLAGSPVDSTIFVLNAATRTVRTSMGFAGIPRRMAFSADGANAYVATEGNYILRFK